MTHYGFLSTFPPTRCGLATFTASLSDALVRHDDEGTVVRVLDQPEDRGRPDPRARSRVRTDLIAGDSLSTLRATMALNSCDVAIVQHEYGIYGGRDGDQVLDVLAALRIPAIVVLHTVLVAPTPHQRHVLTEVCRLASAVVVMTTHARDNLAAVYGVDLAGVRVIPHGVQHVALRDSNPHSGRRVVTWGLLSPGKGIEWGIRAMAQLTDITPNVEYVVAGQTHPKVLAHAGESYRTMLAGLAGDLGVGSSVRMDGRYLEAPQLAALIASADVVLLPYDSVDQATSGVLAEAVAAGVPVVATAFPHAVELLSSGAGIVVPHQNPDATAHALREIITGPSVADRMREAALRETNETTWSAVADRYRAVTARLAAGRAA
ncbi:MULTISPECIES: glycosyltransferase [Microbacterium]|uniref:glycosyltransferase n=1 Tax=Microbacterium TaxID=33882 RepID=UPI000696EF45|nr:MULTISPECIES: glycosyltransferase [Microbacterium]MDR7191045.1 glycosyltransferase involved in cell wall biosynthesis [Microbacterium sp. BE35]